MCIQEGMIMKVLLFLLDIEEGDAYSPEEYNGSIADWRYPDQFHIPEGVLTKRCHFLEF